MGSPVRILAGLVFTLNVAAADTVGQRATPASGTPGRLPGPELNLTLKAPITTWDEAVPLGNGLLGGLLWGEGRTLRLSLDRGDLWDERPADGVRWTDFNYATMRRLVAEGRNEEFNKIFDAPYDGLHPTKLPAGRLEITLPEGTPVDSFELNLATAEGRAHLADRRRVDVFFSATEPVVLVRLPGRVFDVSLGPPPALAKLGYRTSIGRDSLHDRWFSVSREQDWRRLTSYFAALPPPPDSAGRRFVSVDPGSSVASIFAVYAGWRETEGSTLLAATVAFEGDGINATDAARKRVEAALETGYERLLRPHAEWWRRFWSASRVQIPDAAALRHYCLVQYFYGAASRPGAPPMPLQGVWTADAGGLPPWKGDYHNDLNTQMTYFAYQAAGHFDEGRVFLDLLWDRLPRFRRFAQEFYDAPGAAVPGVMSLAGEPLGGWGHYSLSPTMGAWCAHLFYLHWRYTADPVFLRDRAYPWCKAVGQFLRHLLAPGPDGVLVLPLSTSPEIYDNSARAWLRPNSNFDLATARMLFLALAEMADALGQREEGTTWSRAAQGLGPLHVREDGTLKLDPASDLTESHRHLSNLMPIHPFNLLTIDGDAEARRMIAASLASWDALGTKAWVGYSFSWMACLRARVGDAEAALHYLDIYLRAFILRNGFHANGDQLKAGYAAATYRPFTLEGNFLAAQAVHEMLLQSWSPTPGRRDTEVIRIFPAMPRAWQDAAFEDLRTEGGHRVSATRVEEATTWLRVAAGSDGPVRIRDNFGGHAIRWSRQDVNRIAADFVVSLRAGETIEARLSAPSR